MASDNLALVEIRPKTGHFTYHNFGYAYRFRDFILGYLDVVLLLQTPSE